MSEKRYKSITPRGQAVFPKLNEPDTKYDAAGVYQVKLAYDPNDPVVQKFITKLEAAQAQLFEEFKAEKPIHKKFKLSPVYTEELDKEGDETGRILFNFKMKASGVSKKTGKKWERKPPIFDASGKPMPNPPEIWGGSELKVSFEAVPGPVQSSKLFFLSLRMNAVQVLELVSAGGASAESYGFGEEDGYNASEEEAQARAKMGEAEEDPPFDTDGPADDGDF